MNWTHFRTIWCGPTSQSVLAYGSAARARSHASCDTAVAGNPRIFATPEPIVLFAGFGDNALELEVHFWIRIPTPDGAPSGRERFALSASTICFDRRESSIAFPQRDVHLDAARPVPVQIVPQAVLGALNGDRSAAER